MNNQKITSDRETKFLAFVKSDVKNNRGRLINACDELRYLLNNPQSNKIFSKHNLNNLLTYATTFSKYYAHLQNFQNLNDFPILTKQDLKNNWNKIRIANYNNIPDNVIKFTSGSTGTPFKMIMDKYKHCRWIAGNKIFRENVGVKSHEKTVFISETIRDKEIPLKRQKEDNVYYLDCKYLDDNSINKLVKYLVDNNVRTLTALASVLDKIAFNITIGKVPEWKGDFIAIFSVSEPLKENTRTIVSKYFNCPVYVYYANEENGALACEDGSEHGCRANNVDFFFEILDMNSNKPVKDGEMGRLVITDYFNKAFPIIRYENGDLVQRKCFNDGRMYFTHIGGRKADTLYSTKGKMIHYFNGISFLEPLLDIKQFQLIQHSYTEFTWILNTSNHKHEEYIIKKCKKIFGKDAKFKFKYVNSIPMLRSGKTRMTICKIPEKLN